jgi:hypothetical protein
MWPKTLFNCFTRDKCRNGVGGNGMLRQSKGNEDKGDGEVRGPNK